MPKAASSPGWVDEYVALRQRALGTAGATEQMLPAETAYDEFCDWYAFAYVSPTVLERVAQRLGYAGPEPEPGGRL